jgi:pimeloyl-ACP methyl ester carboxylesterase
VNRQILFIQGGGPGAHDEWDDTLVGSLRRELGPQYEIRYPRMPEEASPAYPAWNAALEPELETLGDRAILVGHSIGGTILVNALAEQRPKRSLAGVFLIAAPFVGPGGWPSDDIAPMRNLGARLPKDLPLFLYHGTKDGTAPVAHADLCQAAIPQAHVHKLDGRDHQLNNDLSEVAADIRALTD